MMKFVDVLVDGEFHIEERDPQLLWKGSKNQRVIKVQESLAKEDPTIPILHCGDYTREPVTAPQTLQDAPVSSCLL